MAGKGFQMCQRTQTTNSLADIVISFLLICSNVKTITDYGAYSSQQSNKVHFQVCILLIITQKRTNKLC